MTERANRRSVINGIATRSCPLRKVSLRLLRFDLGVVMDRD
jgi:hypothetical protein